MKKYLEILKNGENTLKAIFEELDKQLQEYAKNTADISEDEEMNQLTFFTFAKESLDPMFAMVFISYDILMKCRDAYVKAEKELGTYNKTVIYYQMFINYASLKHEAYDKICYRYEALRNEAAKYLANGCKCGQKLQTEKLPARILENINKKEGEN